MIYPFTVTFIIELIDLFWSEIDSEKVLTQLESAFMETPRRFFTEHDLHSNLYNLVETELRGQGELFFDTRDSQKTILVHHEYPTPFRCDMSKHGFKIAGEKDRTGKGGLYRRGHYDLVVLNPDFVRRYDLVTVAGKNYKRFCLARDRIDVTPLLWACEIIFGAHTEDDLPINWVNLVTQDSLKVIGTLNYKVGREVNFLRQGDVIVFLGTRPNEKTKILKEKIRQFSEKKQFKIRIVTAT